MEGPDISQYTDHDTVAQNWSQERIYDSLWGRDWRDESPVIAAAGLEDSSILRLLLRRAQLLSDDEREDVLNLEHDHWLLNTAKWPTPILRAIERQRLENLQLLLDHGANPNGISDETQKERARLDRRFWLSDKLLHVPYNLTSGVDTINAEDVGKVTNEFKPFTEDELAKRRSCITQFWTEPHKTGLEYSSDDMLLHAVVRAGTATPAILDELLSKGADVSVWLGPGVTEKLPDEDDLSPSAFARSTPLHAAIASNNMTMLRYLLDRGFNPNSRALITGSCAISPAQYAVITDNPEAYSVLSSHDKLENTVVTPVFGVHILHLAVAHLRVDLIRATNLPLSSAPATALGHTLLHIACLPYQACEVQTSKKVQQSIHDIRKLKRSRYAVNYPDKARYDSFGKRIERDWIPEVEREPSPFPTVRDMPEELLRQADVCKLLVAELGPGLITAADTHGNTALHYLAGSWFLNESLISWMRAQGGGEGVWQDTKNMWGHTPQVLWDDNQQERNNGGADPCDHRCKSGHCVRGASSAGQCTIWRGCG